ncbi:hypothetical protein [Streptomyces sp. NBC_01530]|uniref:hypothetical protein n=1 Tax=Streptomyces sp. NBC_01530 TaxID=2903895 RepID=UPI00386F6998
MDFRPAGRAPGAFQQLLAPDEIKALYRRAFGTEARPLSAVELGMGMFNST